MKALLRKTFLAAAALVVSGTVAGAQVGVQYCTQYSFTNTFATTTTAGCGQTASLQFTDVSQPTSVATVTFTGQGLTNVVTPTNALIGNVAVSGANGTVSFASVVGGTAQIFLRILQFVPSIGNATVAGLLNGSIVATTSSTATVNWNDPSRFASIGIVNYEVEHFASGITAINAQSSGPQSIFAQVTATPEPGSLLLMGSGLAGFAFFGVGFRRRRNSSV